MLFNRIAVTPDEERAVCHLAARTLLAAEDDPGFFPDGHRAADYPYLERSKFQVGRPEDTALRELPPPPAPSAARPAAELPLPAAPLPDVSLAEALRRRSPCAGRCTGRWTRGPWAGSCGRRTPRATRRDSRSPTAPYASSSYLSRPADDPDAVGIDEAPAVLAVHLPLSRTQKALTCSSTQQACHQRPGTAHPERGTGLVTRDTAVLLAESERAALSS
ncbi:hypothetical protein [Streptomyces naphthomycinicus]|uniref:hypothetical protein n=1 Tax=Streptomyces naphthomycinicus TaxID=2872625 RepID=UPI001CED2961|nr:hypothetical protein [Streptomyces sp. TML10]